MLSRFLNYFRDEEDSNPSFIQMTRNILIFVILINLFLLPLVIGLFGEESRNIPAFFVLSINLILEIISLYYAIRGKVGMAKLIVPLALIMAIAIIAVNTNGLRDISIVGLPLVLVIAALLLGKRAMWVVAPIAVITALVIAVLDLTSGRTITKAVSYTHLRAHETVLDLVCRLLLEKKTHKKKKKKITTQNKTIKKTKNTATLLLYSITMHVSTIYNVLYSLHHTY